MWVLPLEGWHGGLGGCTACHSSSRETIWRGAWRPLFCSEDLRATSSMWAQEKGLGPSLRQLHEWERCCVGRLVSSQGAGWLH